MGRKNKFDANIKVQACLDYLEGNKSISEIANMLEVNKITIYKWVRYYKQYGSSAFIDKPRNKQYSKALKTKVVNDYLSGKESINDLAIKYNILSNAIVYQWVKVYNSGIELKGYNPQGEVYTMKRRETTLEERLEIVEFTLKNNKEYKLAASKFNIPYSLVYQWTNKFLKNGPKSLEYQKRGPQAKNFINDNLSETEKLKRENEILKDKLEYANLENQVLKKKAQFEEENELRLLGKRKFTKR